jgi:hypothetical protein
MRPRKQRPAIASLRAIHRRANGDLGDQLRADAAEMTGRTQSHHAKSQAPDEPRGLHKLWTGLAESQLRDCAALDADYDWRLLR